MLIGKNLIMIEGKPVVEYDRIYLTHGANDKLAERDKTSKGSDVQWQDKIWKGSKPDGKSTTAPADLIQAALQYFKSAYPLPEKNEKGEAISYTPEQIEENAWRQFLQAADYGNDLKMQASLRADYMPVKAISKEEGIKKAAKLFQAMHPKWSAEKCLEKAKAQAEESDD